MAEKLKAGDKVKLITGDGPIMGVERQLNIGIDEWVCTYWSEEEKKFVTKNFKGSVLVKVPSPES